MAIAARYTHTNLVSSNWRQLVAFYEQVFGCERVPPERDLAGRWLEEGTGVPGATIRGIHLRLPGLGEDGPTLEVLQFGQTQEHPPTAPDRPGFGHIAFSVQDVGAARAVVLEAKGHELGRVVTADIANSGRITFVYVTDPEGNVIELQQWAY